MRNITTKAISDGGKKRRRGDSLYGERKRKTKRVGEQL
jgi:hypothetical protein